MTATVSILPSAWAIFAQAIAERRPVRARYHGHERLLCPHAIGWKHGKAKLLAFQAGGTTQQGPLPLDPQQRWRSLFVDDIQNPTITNEPWTTAPNYSLHTNAIDTIAIAIDDLK
jgi:hypothetical protein